jgi:hypothetical protein
MWGRIPVSQTFGEEVAAFGFLTFLAVGFQFNVSF